MNTDMGLGNVGNMGMLVTSVLTLGVGLIVLLTFAPTVVGNIDGIYLETVSACEINSERITQVAIPAGSDDGADKAWLKVGGGTRVAVDSAKCAAALGSDTVTAYTPKGTEITIGYASSALVGMGGEWSKPSSSLTALAGGTLVQLLVSAAAILVPAGALGYLAYSGSMMVQEQIGGGTLAVAIGATIIVVVVGAILPEIFGPLDGLFNVLDGHRFEVFQNGIGQLGSVLGNFLGIALLGGLVTLGMALWRGRQSQPTSTEI